MSWNDVIIGTGFKGCSATLALDLIGRGHVSHNDVSYWVSDVYLGMGMTIMKDTGVGRNLADMIRGKVHPETIHEWLKGKLLDHVDHRQLMTAVENAIATAFLKGREAQAETIRNALMLP